jgi:hypothetical protein
MTSQWREHGHLPFLLIVVRPAFRAIWMWDTVNVIPSVQHLPEAVPFSTSVPPVAVTSRQGASARVLWHVFSLGIHCGYNNPRLPACCFNKFIPYYTNRRQQPSLLFHWFLHSYFWLHSVRQFSLQLHLVTLNFLLPFYISCRIKCTRSVWVVLHYSSNSLLFHIWTAMLTVLNIKICLVIIYQACYTSLLFPFVHTYYIHEHITTSVVPYMCHKFRLCVAYSLKISSNTYMYFIIFLIIMWFKIN